MTTLDADDIASLLDAEIAPGITVRDGLIAAFRSAHDDVDKDRDAGTITSSLPGSGLNPIVFDVDDMDRPNYRHRRP